MSKNKQTQYYPTSIRIGDVPYTILSDEDLLLAVRWTGGDDLHDLVKTRLLYAEEMPDRQSILTAIEEIQSAISDAERAVNSLYDQFEL